MLRLRVGVADYLQRELLHCALLARHVDLGELASADLVDQVVFLEFTLVRIIGHGFRLPNPHPHRQKIERFHPYCEINEIGSVLPLLLLKDLRILVLFMNFIS
jgi:hypothetical protein